MRTDSSVVQNAEALSRPRQRTHVRARHILDNYYVGPARDETVQEFWDILAGIGRQTASSDRSRIPQAPFSRQSVHWLQITHVLGSTLSRYRRISAPGAPRAALPPPRNSALTA